MPLQPARTDLLPAEKGAGVSLWYVATRLGVVERRAEWIVAYVRLLHANDGFPPPLPDYLLTGRGRSGIHRGSRWLRDAVDAWFDGFIPPQLVTVAQDLQTRRDAERLDQRAQELAA